MAGSPRALENVFLKDIYAISLLYYSIMTFWMISGPRWAGPGFLIGWGHANLHSKSYSTSAKRPAPTLSSVRQIMGWKPPETVPVNVGRAYSTLSPHSKHSMFCVSKTGIWSNSKVHYHHGSCNKSVRSPHVSVPSLGPVAAMSEPLSSPTTTSSGYYT